ncbi:hypothetical protein HYDPIDRAFT_43478 [Hydnomerulius pinastri MD-312]|uniref:Uncharacterized protein n=1 Tax=Hydnomerulius pinastri MD-312 TaxID=994086 RepID=A0A0C9WA27_9AGAM|nr:hypothetical protein HYDPIDRAFT_43478 [Hydnomerulius pinastri MD-312]
MSTPSPQTPSDPFSPEQMRGNLCFCGNPTVEDHDFCFCSPHCAREDALRALDDTECHYRDVVRRACIRAGVPDLYGPRRRMSAEYLRAEERPDSGRPLKLVRPAGAAHRRNVSTVGGDAEAPTENEQKKNGRFPTLSQVTGVVLAKKALAGEELISESRDRPRWHGFGNASASSARATPETRDADALVQQISLDVIQLPEEDMLPRPHTLKRAPQSTTGLKNNIRKSVAALFNAGKARAQGFNKASKNNDFPALSEIRADLEIPQDRVFGHPINAPSTRDVLPASPPRRSPPLPVPRGLRRSVSFAGWDAFPTDPVDEEDTLMRVLEEMRDEMRVDSFEPRDFFDEGDE